MEESIMGQTVTSRLPDDLNKELERIAKIEDLDKSSLIRRFLNKAIDQWNVSHAISLFQKGEISLGQAIEMSHRSVWELLLKLNELKIPLHYDLSEFQADLETLKQEW